LRKNLPYSYIIEADGKQQWCHANHLRKYNERVNEVVNHNCAIIFDSECDFGNIPTLQFNDQSTCNDVETNTHFGENEADECDVTYNGVTMPLQNLDGDETYEFGEMFNSQNQSSVVLIHDSCDVRTDQSFDSSLPSARIDRSKLTHLSEG
jgi:hypothetical protein